MMLVILRMLLFKIRSHNHTQIPHNEQYTASVNSYKSVGQQFIEIYTPLKNDNISSSPIIDLKTVVPINIAAWPATKPGEVYAIQVNYDDNDTV